MDLARIKHSLQDECRLSPDRPVVVGLSGGADSLCLLLVLEQLGYPLIAAHFNHRLRAEAGEDAQSAQLAAERLGVPFVYGEASVGELAQKEGLSIEEAARVLRYRFLFENARQAGAQAVAVGHTADDQAETVLMHFLRGTGLAGLRGMPPCSAATEWDDRIPLVRPLLDIGRAETVACCQAAGLEPAFDRTNLDPSYTRNRVRLELIPFLETYNPQVKQALLRLSRSAAGDYAIVEAAAQAAWERARIEEGTGFVVLSLTGLSGLSRAMLRNILRVAVGRLRPGLRDVDFDLLDRAAGFVEQPTRTLKLDLANGVSLSRGGGRLFVYEHGAAVLPSAWPRLPDGQGTALDVPGHVEVGNGWVIAAEWANVGREQTPWQAAEPGMHAWLDAGCLVLPLEVRARRPGDRFAPLGMDGHSLKLSDYFVNEKLPQLARARWPLVCSGDQIVWVPGFRPADACRIAGDTQRTVHLCLRPEKE